MITQKDIEVFQNIIKDYAKINDIIKDYTDYDKQQNYILDKYPDSGILLKCFEEEISREYNSYIKENNFDNNKEIAQKYNKWKIEDLKLDIKIGAFNIIQKETGKPFLSYEERRELKNLGFHFRLNDAFNEKTKNLLLKIGVPEKTIEEYNNVIRKNLSFDWADDKLEKEMLTIASDISSQCRNALNANMQDFKKYENNILKNIEETKENKPQMEETTNLIQNIKNYFSANNKTQKEPKSKDNDMEM